MAVPAGWKPHRDRGAALVEFALILPLLVALLLGTVTGGLALAAKNSMTNAVREGARLGATLPEGASWNDWAATVRTRVVELSGGDLTTSQVCVAQVEWDAAAGAETVLGVWPTGSACPAPNEPDVPTSTPDGSCVVKVWAQRPADFHTFFFSKTLTLRAAAVGRYERAECP